MYQSLALGFGLSISLLANNAPLAAAAGGTTSESATFTGTTLETTLGTLSLVENDELNLINSDGNIECSANSKSDELCMSLSISNIHGINGIDCSNGIETLELTLYGSSGDSDNNCDLFGIFSMETDSSSGNDFEYFSFFNDWSGGVSVPTTSYGTLHGGVLIAPHCESTSLLSIDESNGGSDWPNQLWELYGVSNAWDTRTATADGDNDNWELLTSDRVGEDTSPLKYKIVNNHLTNEMSAYFDLPDDNDFNGVSCNYYNVFDGLNNGNNYLIGFGSDQGSMEFTQIDVTLTCEIPTQQPTNLPTQIPTQPNCDEYSHTCTAKGDPHITTWDGTYYHFQGEGYFDYVKSCDDSVASLPFMITGRQDYVNDKKRATRLGEIIVTIFDGSNNDIIISYPSSGIPTFKDNGESAIGEYTLSDGTGSYTISNKNFEITFEIDSLITAKLKFYYYGASLTIETTGDCLNSNNVFCGLCGDLNDDDNDDFTRCDNLHVIDNTDVDLTRQSSSSTSEFEDAWIRTHRFGESCCNFAFDYTYLYLVDNDYESDCNNTNNFTIPITPDIECWETIEVEEICFEAWNTYCLYCDSTDASDEWIENCIFDLCAVCQDNTIINNEWSLLTFETAVEQGCLDDSINECEVDCPAPTKEPTLLPSTSPSKAPSKQPTKEPTLVPSSSPTYHEHDLCLGCNAGGSISNGHCHALGTVYNFDESDYGVFACYGTFSGGMDDSSLDAICGTDYHVCDSASEASELGLTKDECINTINSDEIFFARESGYAGECESYTGESGHSNDVWGCSGDITSGSYFYGTSTLDTQKCIYIEDSAYPECETLSHFCGYFSGSGSYDYDTSILDLGTDYLDEYNYIALNDASYGGVLCCKDIPTLPPSTLPTTSPTEPTLLPTNAPTDLYSNTEGCDDVDGGGWILVRHVSDLAGTTHPEIDRLAGEAYYQELFDYDAQSDSSWSLDFSGEEFNQFLFAFGDCSDWLVATKDEVRGDFYDNEDRCILASHDNPDSTSTAKWYNRDGVSEDPWISTKDHWECRTGTGGVESLTDPCMVYGENGYSGEGEHEYGFTQHKGGNVWIRQKDDETRSCN